MPPYRRRGRCPAPTAARRYRRSSAESCRFAGRSRGWRSPWSASTPQRSPTSIRPQTSTATPRERRVDGRPQLLEREGLEQMAVGLDPELVMRRHDAGGDNRKRWAEQARRSRELHAPPADVVILDVSMPELDGWATLERIRDLSDVPVLMLTAHDAELERVRGLQGGADDYVAKPFGRQELVARVDALLRRSGG